MSNDNLTLSAKHLAMARAINDEFEGRAMPAEAARQMEAHLSKASGFRRTNELEANERYLAEPQYKHDMSYSGTFAFGAGADAWDEPGASRLSASTVKAIAGFIRGTKSALVEDTDGNKLVPADFAGTILKELSRAGVIRGQATIRPTNRRTVDVGSIQVGTPTWGKLELDDSLADGLGAPPSDKDTITVWDLNALVKIGRDEMEDSDEGLVELVREGVVAKLAEVEDDAFATGTGDDAKQPAGFANGTTITQHVTSAAGGVYAADDVLNGLIYAVPAWARKSAGYYGNGHAEQAVALFKDGTDNYLWQPSAAADLPARLRGRPWYTVDGLASGTLVGSDDFTRGKPLFFGDMHAAYMIADRRKFTVDILRERFIDEGKIGVLFTHRVGGGVIRPSALAYYSV